MPDTATPRANQRVAWFNGHILPERDIVLPFRDAGFRRGDGAFDMTRTFKGRIFRLEEHIERFYRTLRYMRLDPGMSREEMARITREVVAANLHLLAPGEDYWVAQRISRGVDAVGDEGWEHTGPNLVIECQPLPLKKRAPLFRDGIDVITPSVRRTPPESLTPRAKMANYLNLVVADQEVKAQNPDAWSILLDHNGNLCEGVGCNIFLLLDGRLVTPQARYVLPGVSRQAVIDLAGDLGIAFAEADLDLYDAFNAEEVFLTSTSLCLCPVRSLNGQTYRPVPGPVTRRLTEAYARMVDCDFVAQYLAHLPA